MVKFMYPISAVKMPLADEMLLQKQVIRASNAM